MNMYNPDSSCHLWPPESADGHATFRPPALSPPVSGTGAAQNTPFEGQGI
jgi:hypothetical protein